MKNVLRLHGVEPPRDYQTLPFSEYNLHQRLLELLRRVSVPRDLCNIPASKPQFTADAKALHFEAGVLEGLNLRHYYYI